MYSDNPLPHTGDFPESLLTSQLGLPDDKTGILPCLFTLKIKSILNKRMYLFNCSKRVQVFFRQNADW